MRDEVFRVSEVDRTAFLRLLVVEAWALWAGDLPPDDDVARRRPGAPPEDCEPFRDAPSG